MARLGHSYAHEFTSLQRGLEAISRGATVTDGPPCETTKGWRRQANDVGVGAQFVCCPKNVPDIAKIITWAEKNEKTVRAVGVGHSYSDVVDTTGIIVDMSEISGVVGDIDDSHIKDADEPHAFVTVQAGTSIEKLNTLLRDHEPPLALENMGSYDAQHIAGAISTGTHGSGKEFGPMESQVVALKIVAATPKDRQDGDNREEHILQRNELIQNKRQEFLAAVISMGCAGIITETKLKVVPAYKLFEERTLEEWETIKEEIASGTFQDNEDWRHVEVALDPYPLDAGEDRMCLVTKRRRLKNGESSKRYGGRSLASKLAWLAKPFRWFLVRKMRNPKKAAKFVRKTLKGLAHKGYRDHSDKVLQLGAENEAVKIADGIEFMFLVSSDEPERDIAHLLDVVDELLAIGKRRHDAGIPFLSAPIAMRFVGCSDALVAPQFGVVDSEYVVTLEMGVVRGVNGIREILEECERLMLRMRGRPHWGLNFNHYCRADIKAVYDSRFTVWVGIVGDFNSSRVFDNALTRRLGI